MTWSGSNATLAQSGVAAPPVGLYGRFAYFSVYGSGPLIQSFDARSNEITLYPNDSRLQTELAAARLNGASQTNLVISTGPGAYLSPANLGARITEIRATGQVEGLVFDLDADPAFLTALKNEMTSLAAQKIDLVAVVRYRKAKVFFLNGVISVTAAVGVKTSIPVANHGLSAGDTIIIHGSLNHDGAWVLDPLTDVNNLVIVDPFASETFGVGVMLEEQPESYLARYKADLDSFASPMICIVAPTTQNGHLGALVGAASNVDSLAEEPGFVQRHKLSGVSLDAGWDLSSRAVLIALAGSRAVVLKRHEEDPTGIYINNTPTLAGPTDDQKILPLARIANKLLREVRTRAFPAVNSNLYPRTEDGALGIAALASGGFGAMQNRGELTQATVTAQWAGTSCELTIKAKGPNHVSLINSTITLTPAV